MSEDVRTRALHRAAEVAGGVEKLRVLLGVSAGELRAWMSGEQPPPMSVFLAAVDIISEPESGAKGHRRQTRQRAGELRRHSGVIRARLALTLERAEAMRAAILAARVAAGAPSRKPMSALMFLQMRFAPHQGAAMVDAALGAAVTATSTDMGTLHIVGPEGLMLAAQRGFDQEFLDYFAGATHDGSCDAAAKKLQRIIVDDVQSDPIFAGTRAAEVMAKARVNACQSTPLVSPGGELMGMMSTHYERPGRPNDRELDLVDHIARRTAFWLDGGSL